MKRDWLSGPLVLLLGGILATTTSAQGLPVAQPESVGMSAERLERIRTLTQAYVDEG